MGQARYTYIHKTIFHQQKKGGGSLTKLRKTFTTYAFLLWKLWGKVHLCCWPFSLSNEIVKQNSTFFVCVDGYWNCCKMDKETLLLFSSFSKSFSSFKASEGKKLDKCSLVNCSVSKWLLLSICSALQFLCQQASFLHTEWKY